MPSNVNPYAIEACFLPTAFVVATARPRIPGSEMTLENNFKSIMGMINLSDYFYRSEKEKLEKLKSVLGMKGLYDPRGIEGA